MIAEGEESNSLLQGSWSFGGPYTGLYGGYANSVPINYGLSHMADTEEREEADQEEKYMKLDPRTAFRKVWLAMVPSPLVWKKTTSPVRLAWNEQRFY